MRPAPLQRSCPTDRSVLSEELPILFSYTFLPPHNIAPSECIQAGANYLSGAQTRPIRSFSSLTYLSTEKFKLGWDRKCPTPSINLLACKISYMSFHQMLRLQFPLSVGAQCSS